MTVNSIEEFNSRLESERYIKSSENYQFLSEMDKKLIDELILKFPETKMTFKMLVDMRDNN